jgi:predicted MFS family arabinose efflux permease
LLLIFGSSLCLLGQPLLFNLAWGVIVGIGCGTLTMAYGAFIARLWFERTGTATGFLTAAAVTGQFALLPFWAWMSDLYGWRTSLIGSSALALIAIAANLVFLGPRFSGIDAISRRYLDKTIRLNDMLRTVKLAVSQPVFWIIALHFAMCGATTNGLMWSNFTPAANDQGLSTASASMVLLLIGVFNIPGTIASGWFTDRMSNRRILSFTFICRAMTLLSLPVILGANLDWRLGLFGVVFGIFDVSTVPPVIRLCNRVFGDRGPQIFSWINVSHQLGAGAAALVGSGIKLYTGSFEPLWFVAAGTCLTAAVLVYTSQYRPIAGSSNAAMANAA